MYAQCTGFPYPLAFKLNKDKVFLYLLFFLLCFSLFCSTTSRALIQQCSVTPQKFFAPTRILEALKMLFDLRNRSLTEIFFVFTSIILESFNYFIFTLLYFIIGLQHCKIYIFDDSVIISGANLSHDYFTNRQVSIQRGHPLSIPNRQVNIQCNKQLWPTFDIINNRKVNNPCGQPLI